jgi:hypothetical protein
MKWEIRFHPGFVGFVDAHGFAELAFALGPLQAKEMTTRGLRAQNFSASGNFETFRDCFPRLAAGN